MIHDDTPSLCFVNCALSIKNCELIRKNREINVNLGAAGVAGATYFMFCHIYARERNSRSANRQDGVPTIAHVCPHDYNENMTGTSPLSTSEHGECVWLLKDVKREIERVKFESNVKLNIRQLVNAIILAFIKEHNDELKNIRSG